MEFYDTSQLPANLAKCSYALALLRINPNGKAPILAMSGLAKEKMCNGIGHSYWTKTGEYTSLQLTVAIASDATTTFTAAAGDVAKLVPNLYYFFHVYPSSKYYLKLHVIFSFLLCSF